MEPSKQGKPRLLKQAFVRHALAAAALLGIAGQAHAAALPESDAAALVQPLDDKAPQWDRSADRARRNAETALAAAAWDGDTQAVRLLLDRGTDIHAMDDLALLLAAENGRTETARLLLDRGANIHAQDDVALLWAAGNGHAAIVRLLLDRGADAYTRKDLTLRWATKHGHAEIAAMLRAALALEKAPIPGSRRPL